MQSSSKGPPAKLWYVGAGVQNGIGAGPHDANGPEARAGMGSGAGRAAVISRLARECAGLPSSSGRCDRGGAAAPCEAGATWRGVECGGVNGTMR